jgi:adenylate kinase
MVNCKFYLHLPQNYPNMPSIKFTEIELGFLRNHYEQELIDAEMYVAEIRRILSKFGRSEPEMSAEKPLKKRRGRPSKKAQNASEVKAAVAKAPKKKKAGKVRRKKAGVAKGATAPKAAAKKTVKKAVKKAVKPVEPTSPAVSQT